MVSCPGGLLRKSLHNGLCEVSISLRTKDVRNSSFSIQFYLWPERGVLKPAIYGGFFMKEAMSIWPKALTLLKGSSLGQ